MNLEECQLAGAEREVCLLATQSPDTLLEGEEAFVDLDPSIRVCLSELSVSASLSLPARSMRESSRGAVRRQNEGTVG